MSGETVGGEKEPDRDLAEIATVYGALCRKEFRTLLTPGAFHRFMEVVAQKFSAGVGEVVLSFPQTKQQIPTKFSIFYDFVIQTDEDGVDVRTQAKYTHMTPNLLNLAIVSGHEVLPQSESYALLESLDVAHIPHVPLDWDDISEDFDFSG